jgi:hypothetical protein
MRYINYLNLTPGGKRRRWKMKDDDKKFLTEWMGEEWFPKLIYSNRTFTTWQDLGDLKDKLVEEGLWRKFEKFAVMAFYAPRGPDTLEGFTDWLFNPIRLPELVAEFLKGRRGDAEI